MYYLEPIGDMETFWGHRILSTLSTKANDMHRAVCDLYTPFAAKQILHQWVEADEYTVTVIVDAEDIDGGIYML